MGLLRRTTPVFSVLWLAAIVLHLSNRPQEVVPSSKSGGDLRGTSTAITTKEPIHLVYSSDDKEIPGVEASIKSVMCHASEEVQFHYVGDSPILQDLPNVHFYNLTQVSQKYNLDEFTNPYKRTKEFELGLNSNHANYLRFVIAELLPQASKAMWMDGDTIINCDVVPLVRNALTTNNYIIAAVPVFRKPMGVNGSVLKRKYASLEISFNAGVYIVDLDRWRSRKIAEKVRKLAMKNRKKLMYKYGSQPPLVLTIGDKFEHLPAIWNQKADHLDRTPNARQDACLIHWSGTTKPWDENGIEKELWKWCPEQETGSLA